MIKYFVSHKQLDIHVKYLKFKYRRTTLAHNVTIKTNPYYVRKSDISKI